MKNYKTLLIVILIIIESIVFSQNNIIPNYNLEKAKSTKTLSFYLSNHCLKSPTRSRLTILSSSDKNSELSFKRALK